MAVNNSLAKTSKASTSDKISFIANNEEVKISLDDVKNYLTSGNGNITTQEAVLFISLCKYQHLNPFIREAYLIKYGNDNPATMVVGKDVLLKRAMRSEKFEGLTAGVIILTADGDIKEREGTFVLDGEQLVGGWAKVQVKGYSAPIYASVSLKEYMGRKKDGTPNGQWSNKPATMIRKVALAQALREAFPEENGSLYEQEEIKEASDIVLDTTPVSIPSESPVEVSEPIKVIEPEPEAETLTGVKQSGQAGIDDIMFPESLGGNGKSDLPFEL